jgi:hypothetical protein
VRGARQDGKLRPRQARRRVAENAAADEAEESRQVLDRRQVAVAGDDQHRGGEAHDLLVGEVFQRLVRLGLLAEQRIEIRVRVELEIVGVPGRAVHHRGLHLAQTFHQTRLDAVEPVGC